MDINQEHTQIHWDKERSEDIRHLRLSESPHPTYENCHKGFSILMCMAWSHKEIARINLDDEDEGKIQFNTYSEYRKTKNKHPHPPTTLAKFLEAHQNFGVLLKAFFTKNCPLYRKNKHFRLRLKATFSGSKPLHPDTLVVMTYTIIKDCCQCFASITSADDCVFDTFPSSNIDYLITTVINTGTFSKITTPTQWLSPPWCPGGRSPYFTNDPILTDPGLTVNLGGAQPGKRKRQEDAPPPHPCQHASNHKGLDQTPH